MRSDLEKEIISMISRNSGLSRDKVVPTARFVEDLRIDGDDAIEILLDVSKKYSMDVSGFDSTRYFRSEPTLLSLLPFLPSQKKRTEPKQPLTVGELIEAARRGSLQSK